MIAAVLDHLWQSTLFLLGAGLLTLMLRKNAAQIRYCLWFVTSVKFLIPFSLLVALGNHVVVPVKMPAISPPTTYVMEQMAQPFSGVTPTLSVPAPGAPNFSTILFGLWMVGFLGVLLLWLARWARINAVLRSATPLPLVAPAPVKSSQSILEPGLVGIWRPVLLLPQGIAAHLSQAELHAILAHELCHLRRRDNLTAAIHMLVEALFWFYPLIWWLGARLIEERERSCDEAVLASGNDPQIYAESILKVCRFYVRSPLACTAGVSGSGLSKRMEAIMNKHVAVRLNTAKKLSLAAIGVAAFVLPLGAGFLMPPVANAQAQNATLPTSEEVSRKLAEQALPRKAIPFDPKQFDKYVGYYQFGPNTIFTVTREGDHFLSGFVGQGDTVEAYPESETKFFAKVVAAQISFATDSQGQTTELVLHQSGYEQHAKKVDEAVAKKIETAMEQRIRNNTPSPGTEAALRRHIEGLEKGQPPYDEMSPALAVFLRQQMPAMQRMIQKVGGLKSIAFKAVGSDGLDIYDAIFEHGQVEWRIGPLTPDGKVDRRRYRELP